jgi:hypothetical protein
MVSYGCTRTNPMKNTGSLDLCKESHHRAAQRHFSAPEANELGPVNSSTPVVSCGTNSAEPTIVVSPIPTEAVGRGRELPRTRAPTRNSQLAARRARSARRAARCCRRTKPGSGSGWNDCRHRVAVETLTEYSSNEHSQPAGESLPVVPGSRMVIGDGALIARSTTKLRVRALCHRTRKLHNSILTATDN